MSAEQFSKMATALLGPSAAGIDLTNHQQLLDFAESLVAGNTSDSSADTPPVSRSLPVTGGRGRGRGRGRGAGRGRGRVEVPVPSDSSDVDAAAEVLSEQAVTSVYRSLGMANAPVHNSDEEDSDIQEMCAEAQAIVAGDDSPTE